MRILHKERAVYFSESLLLSDDVEHSADSVRHGRITSLGARASARIHEFGCGIRLFHGCAFQLSGAVRNYHGRHSRVLRFGAFEVAHENIFLRLFPTRDILPRLPPIFS